MNDRLSLIYSELVEKCTENQTTEFEFFIEVWGVMWYPWFVEINGINQSFSFNDLSTTDLDDLVKSGCIEYIGSYSKEDIPHYVYKLISHSSKIGKPHITQCTI